MPITAPSSPAPKRTPNKSSVSPPPSAASRASARSEALKDFANIPVALLIMTKQYADAGAVDMHAANIADEAAKVADENEAFANILDKLTAVGPYAALFAAVMPLAMQLAANHGKIDAAKATLLAGVMHPDVLASKIQADMDTKRAEMLAQAKEAQERANSAQAELAKAEAA